MSINPLKRKPDPIFSTELDKRPKTTPLIRKVTCDLEKIFRQINDQQYERKLPEYPLGEQLGKGTLGEVYRVNDIQNAVMKQVALDRCPVKSRNVFSMFCENEIDTQAHLSKNGAPHIPRLYDHFCKRGQKYAMVMENAGENLFDIYIKPFNPTTRQYGIKASLQEIKTVGKKLLEALYAMHEQNIGHFDLKTDNCTKDFIIDFNLSTKVPESLLQPERVKINPYYRPPEVILKCPYGVKADIWSLGCILFQLYTLQNFCNVSDDRYNQTQVNINMLRTHLSRLGLSKIPEHMLRSSLIANTLLQEDRKTLKNCTVSLKSGLAQTIFNSQNREIETDKETESFLDLLGNMIEFDPEKRYSAEQALSHPFFASETSFRLNVSGNSDKRLSILDENGNHLETVHLSDCHQGTCIHVPTRPNYQLQLLDDAEELFAESSLSLTNGCVLNIDANLCSLNISERELITPPPAFAPPSLLKPSARSALPPNLAKKVPFSESSKCDYVPLPPLFPEYE
ncbi:MAG: hypothetical protein COT85_03720 [Chlamydiae bacterium CG10_big_fil_rev_8_21_14_0_10_42_34]|nr:MAG: hypothetical protein COT85_03720 [Chlamydiae bacterium CG10_big_fil_rev_8_21_14_0_10_42_34]